METTEVTADEMQAIEAFLRENAERSGFFASLLEQLERKGSLSLKQILAVRRSMESPRLPATTPAVTEPGMYYHDGGIWRVRWNSERTRLYAERFSPDGGKRFVYDKGAIHRLSPGDRMTVDDCARAGALVGICVVCGRELTDPESVRAGIGPVCRTKV